MERTEIYFNQKKSLTQIFIGAGLFILAVIIPIIFIRIPLFIVSGSFIYFGFKFISKKPQFIISEEGLYIGFDFKRTISWNKIEKVQIKEKSIDYRKMKHIEITIKIKTNAPSKLRVELYPIGNLNIAPGDFLMLINNHLPNKNLV